jgi:hypothetical protein
MKILTWKNVLKDKTRKCFIVPAFSMALLEGGSVVNADIPLLCPAYHVG